MNHRAISILSLLVTSLAFADGPKDNIPDQVRPIPPPGIKIADPDRAELEKGVAALGHEIEALRGALKSKPALLELLPDVEIYHKAVDWALRYDEIYKPQEVAVARDLLTRGAERAQALREGKSPWTTQTGLVVRGYRSKIDDSVQPYGLVVPATMVPSQPSRVDFWFHGRGETLTELAFLDQRHKSPGQFTPPESIVVHLYGRYSCANKFAGEVDLFEALEHLKRSYAVDENRLVVRGFSMGGAACWQFAVHHAGKWCAAAPGAGFSETPDFLRTYQEEVLQPTWYEQKLWHLYDSTDYALNLSNCPTVAYSGEIDRRMEKSFGPPPCPEVRPVCRLISSAMQRRRRRSRMESTFGFSTPAARSAATTSPASRSGCTSGSPRADVRSTSSSSRYSSATPCSTWSRGMTRIRSVSRRIRGIISAHWISTPARRCGSPTTR